MKQAEIGVIGAMQIEVETLLSYMTDKETATVSGIDFVTGDMEGRRIVVAKCGIGKVFAALCAEIMILEFCPRVIVNTGVAGTLTDKLSVGQIAVADAVCQHDMDTSPIGDPYGYLSGIGQVYLPTDRQATECMVSAVSKTGVHYERGVIASGDQFIASREQKERICGRFDGVIACEMEGAAIGQVCTVNHMPFAILRAISDGGDESASVDYPTFLSQAAGHAARVLMSFIAAF